MPCNECTKECVYQKIAEWAGVPVQAINPQTALDGLGGKSWLNDGAALVDELKQLCGVDIPQSVWEAWETVSDIEDYLDLDED